MQIRVKPYEEIVKTFTSTNSTDGVLFTNEMRSTCGKTFDVTHTKNGCYIEIVNGSFRFIPEWYEICDEIHIQIPEGYEIDEENSTFTHIKFKVKEITYKDVANALFADKVTYFPDSRGNIRKTTHLDFSNAEEPVNCISEKQVEKLLAFNKLVNVATYLNNDWIPDFNNIHQNKYIIVKVSNRITVRKVNNNYGIPYFRTRHLAEQAIKILGKDTIDLILDY